MSAEHSFFAGGWDKSVGQRAMHYHSLHCSVSKTAPNTEDEWTVADVTDLNKLVVEVKASKATLAFSASEHSDGGADPFAKEREGRSRG